MFKQYKDTLYDIYDDGRCYSHLSNKFLTPKMSVKYPTYNLTINGKKQQIKVHRMVAETFILNPENKPIVNHKDGNTHNFNCANLEWVTAVNNKKQPPYDFSSSGQIINNRTKKPLKIYQDKNGQLYVNLWKKKKNIKFYF